MALMSTVTAGEQDGESPPGLLYTAVRHLVLTAIYTSTYFAGVAVICMVWVVAALKAGGEFAGFIYLVLLSWALLLGQVDTLQMVDEENEEEFDWSLLTELLVSLAGVIYYNIIMFISIVLALAFLEAGAPVVAVSMALLLPAGDLVAGQKAGLGFAVVLLGGAVWLGENLTEAYENLPVERIVLYMLDLADSIERAMPPLVSHLSLRYIGKRQRFL